MILPGARKYPKELWDTNGEPWQIKFVNQVDSGTKRKETAGLCSPDTRTIKIRKGQTKGDTFLTFLHEVIHMSEFSGDFELAHKDVERLEEHLGGIILANWDQFAGLFG